MTEWAGELIASTARLRLRTFRAEDLGPYAALNADPEVTRYLGGPVDRAESDAIAAWANDLHEREGIGLLAVERASDAQFMGMCGIHHLDWYPDDLELGFRFAREHWGLGYATEAGRAWLRIAFEDRDFARVISVTDAPNSRSIGVMLRLGMSFDHSAELEEDGEPFDAVVYSITHEDWCVLPAGVETMPP